MDKIEKVAIIIPVKNEEETIGGVIDRVKKYSDEILVIDGNSKDKTQQIVCERMVKIMVDDNKGKGQALRKAMKKIKSEIVVFIDGDGSHEANDIPTLVNPIIKGEADMVIASRIKGGSDEAFGNLNFFLRTTGSHIITLLINAKWKVMLTDTQNGFRAIKKEVFWDLGLTENKTTIEQEMVMKALKKGYQIKEIASHEYLRRYGESKIKLHRVWYLYIWCLLKNLLEF